MQVLHVPQLHAVRKDMVGRDGKSLCDSRSLNYTMGTIIGECIYNTAFKCMMVLAVEQWVTFSKLSQKIACSCFSRAL